MDTLMASTKALASGDPMGDTTYTSIEGQISLSPHSGIHSLLRWLGCWTAPI